MYAIIRTGGKQYRVREGDQIEVERLDADEGAEVTLPEVLLVHGDGDPDLGDPLVAGAVVKARVEAQARRPKVRIYNYKNKTRQRRLKGHRQPVTRLTITSIGAPAR
jgi:large subunit ribosomal protein L21